MHVSRDSAEFDDNELFVSKITTHLNFDHTNETVLCRDTGFTFAKNRGIFLECLELETAAGKRSTTD